MRDQFGEGHGLGFGHGRFPGAFHDAVPGIRAVQGARSVQGRTEPAQQGGVAELDIAHVLLGGADRIIKLVFPDPEEPTITECRARRGHGLK